MSVINELLFGNSTNYSVTCRNPLMVMRKNISMFITRRRLKGHDFLSIEA